MNEIRVAKLLGGEKVLKHKIRSEVDFSDMIESGINMRAAKSLQAYIKVSDSYMASMVNLSPKTYRSRKKLKADEGDHLYTIARIVAAAEEAIEGKETAIKWLNTKQPALGNRIPMELAKNSAGAQAVEDLLGRIEYGVYS